MMGIVKIESAVCAVIKLDVNSVLPPYLSANIPAIDAAGVALPITTASAAVKGIGKSNTTMIDSSGNITKRNREENQNPLWRSRESNRALLI